METTAQQVLPQQATKGDKGFRLSWKSNGVFVDVSLSAREGKHGWSGKLEKAIPAGTYVYLFEAKEKAGTTI